MFLRILATFGFLTTSVAAQATVFLDIGQLSPAKGELTRVHGSGNDGTFGTPVAGGVDLDGDGHLDYAVALLRASPMGRSFAGEVDLIFGDGRIGAVVDTSVDQPGILRIAGDAESETAGCEIWMDDVTGDGRGELLVGRQNYSPDPSRIGAGALSIIVGGPELRAFARSQSYLDLRNPPETLTVLTIQGLTFAQRFGIWMRTGDVDGDGIADIVVGADQEDAGGQVDSGAAYVVRGGGHLAQSRVIDLSDALLSGHRARLHPPAPSRGYHVGATCQIADLDGNGRSEVLLAAALNRAGAGISPAGAPGTARATGGSSHGTLYIAWDDNFPPGPWPQDFDMDLSQLPGSQTILHGGARNRIFGEELLGGKDFDGDQMPDLFVGDFLADGSPERNRPNSGIGYVFYAASRLKGLEGDLDSLPAEITFSAILGPSPSAIGADTVTDGDFDGDGLPDLAFGSPHHSPKGRISAGSIHVLYGQAGGWPPTIDTAPDSLPPREAARIAEIHGAMGARAGDRGDTLCYSAASGDINGDGRTDILSNEMLGNGLAAGTADVGNLLILNGASLSNAPVLHFAQFGNGQGFTSELILVNPSDSLTVSGTVRFSGLPEELVSSLDLAAFGSGPASALNLRDEWSFEILPLASVTLATDGEGDLVAGAATVTSNSRLGGSIRFTIPGIGFSAVSSGEPLSGFITPARRTADGINTGLALFNPESDPTSLALTLIDSQAAALPGGASLIEIPAGGHLSVFITDLFPDADLTGFTGTLIAETQSGQIVALVMELGPRSGEFATLPVTPLDK